MQDPIVMLHRPSLKNPTLIVGFAGWTNAGEVATWVIRYLLQALRAVKCAEIRSETFYDLSQERPVIKVEKGLIRSVEYPCNAFYSASTQGAKPRDLVLFLGQEPHLQWPTFSEAFLDVAQHLGVVSIFGIGGLYDNIPHTVEPPVTGLVNQENCLKPFAKIGVWPADYEGPMSIHTHLLTAAARRKIPAVSLWGHVPYYIQSSNAKSCLSILKRLQALIGFELDLTDVRRASEMLDEQINRIIQSKPDLQQYIQSLEQDFSAAETNAKRTSRPLRPASTGEKIIRIDSFLRRDPDPAPQG